MLRRSFHRRTVRCPHAGSPGFSLLEVLVVLVVIGLVAVIGIPSLLSQLGKVRLESTATDIANLMRQTRLRAIRENTTFDVEIMGGSVFGMGFLGEVPVELEFNNPPINIYSDTGAATCLNPYDGGANFDALGVSYQGDGTATATGAICIHDGKGNILQIAVPSVNTQPKIRKYLAAAASPTGSEGFFEKTSYNEVTGAGNVWVWY